MVLQRRPDSAKGPPAQRGCRVRIAAGRTRIQTRRARRRKDDGPGTGDSNPHLFIYSTQDGYNATGCYDLTCSDFVQVSGSVTPGMTLSPVSTSGGTQYEAHLLSYRDPSTGNWWLQYQGVWIGYYPKSLYSSTGLLNRSSRVNVGGEIIDENSSRHTTTDMGSGAFSSSWYHYAAYVRDIKYIDTSNTWQVPTSLSEYETDSNCYDATVGSDMPVRRAHSGIAMIGWRISSW